MSIVRKCTKLHGVATQNTVVGSVITVEASKLLLLDMCHRMSKVHEIWKAGTAEISWDVIIRECHISTHILAVNSWKLMEALQLPVRV
jgi:hypothetical protein